jgi:hypothetical protein
MDSAVSAAVRDPRFLPVTPDELPFITVEVSVLTLPEKVQVPPDELPPLLEIGRHGIIIRQALHQGLLLPQVAPEHGFGAVDFLGQACMKAGLPPDAWLTGADIFLFEARIFMELSPGGDIVEKRFDG